MTGAFIRLQGDEATDPWTVVIHLPKLLGAAVTKVKEAEDRDW